jgi:hypothetical protein
VVDVVVLDVGQRGEIASLYPNRATLKDIDSCVTAVTDVPGTPKEQISFTLPLINSAANVSAFCHNNHVYPIYHTILVFNRMHIVFVNRICLVVFVISYHIVCFVTTTIFVVFIISYHIVFIILY